MIKIYTEEPLKREEDLINERYLEIVKLGLKDKFWDAVGKTLEWKPIVRGFIDVECMNLTEKQTLAAYLKEIVSGDYNDSVINL